MGNRQSIEVDSSRLPSYKIFVAIKFLELHPEPKYGIAYNI